MKFPTLELPWFLIQILSPILKSSNEESSSLFNSLHIHILFGNFWAQEGHHLIESIVLWARPTRPDSTSPIFSSCGMAMSAARHLPPPSCRCRPPGPLHSCTTCRAVWPPVRSPSQTLLSSLQYPDQRPPLYSLSSATIKGGCHYRVTGCFSALPPFKSNGRKFIFPFDDRSCTIDCHSALLAVIFR
jgi:hypothetical protein